MSNFSFGSDPEFMLVDTTGKYRSAIGVVPGTKQDKVTLGNGHYAFYDNVLAEVNIKPSGNKQEAVANFGDCFKRLAKLVGSLRLVPQASQTYDPSECEHPDAMIFGCEPEFCIYNLDENGRIQKVEPPVAMPGNTFRSGGGHIHIGHDICRIWGGKPVEVIRWLDVFVGIPAVCVDHDPTSAARRKLYGGAGTHRVKIEYGVEYRSLSNFWLASPKLVELIYDLVDFTLDTVISGQHEKIEANKDTAREVINTGNRELAMGILGKFLKKHLPTDLHGRIMELSEPIRFDFYKEWKL